MLARASASYHPMIEVLSHDAHILAPYTGATYGLLTTEKTLMPSVSPDRQARAGRASLFHLATEHLSDLLTQLNQRAARDISTVSLYGLCLLAAEMARCDATPEDRSLTASQLGRLLLASLLPGVHDCAHTCSSESDSGAERHDLTDLLHRLDWQLSRTIGQVESLHQRGSEGE